MTRSMITVLVLVFVFFAILSGCSSSDPADPADGDLDGRLDGDDESPEMEIEDGDTDTLEADGDSQETPSDGDDEESAGDGDKEEEADVDELVTLPHEPGAPDPEQVMTDEPFLQEFNHTWNEQPEEIGALVDAIMPPAGYTGFESPSLVAPDGLWISKEGGGLQLLPLPERSSELIDAVVALGKIFLIGSDALYEVASDASSITAIPLPAETTPARLYGSDDGLYVLSAGGLGFFNGSDEPVWHALDPAPTAIHKSGDRLILAWSGSMVAYPTDVAPGAANEIWRVDIDVGTPLAIMTERTLPQALDLLVVGSEGPAGFSMTDNSATAVDEALFADGRVPLGEALCAMPDSNGGFIVGTKSGAYRIVDREFGPEYRVYVPERWMPKGEVRGLLEDTSVTNGPIYFATLAGLGWMTRSNWTLADKVDKMVERVHLRHDREGALSDSHLTIPGDLSTNIPWDSDNDGGWTCYWVISECMRYKLTGDPQAKTHFDDSLHRMLSLRTLTGTEHFLARSVIRIDGCQLDDCDDPDDGEWFKSPDGEWWVKADTSNDEVTSHMLMMGYAYDMCADEEQKQGIVAHVDGIIGGIIDNGYLLIDPQDDKATKFGQFDPFYVNEWPEGALGDGGRRSAQILGAINLAYYLTGKQKYLDAKRELIDEHHYDENVMHIGDRVEYPFCAGSGDCDELALQAFFPLLRYEWDPKLQEKWLVGWRQLYSQLIDQEDAFWDLSNVVLDVEADYDSFFSKRWYKGYPTDLIRFPIYNTVRLDAVSPPDYYRVKEDDPNLRLRSDGHIFPSDERPNIRHNTPQFRFSGGWGSNRELDGGDAIFPYWLGRYYGFIAEP